MPVIRILPHADYCPEGASIQAPRGTSVCEALLDHGIEIEHACEMSCACTTCHVIVKEGLAYDRCQVGVVLNIDPSATFPEYAIYDEDQLFSIVRTQVDVVLPNGAAVLNADDPLVAKMAELCDGEVIFFSGNEAAPLIEDHLKQGGRAVLVRGQEIVLKTARRDEQVLHLPKSPKSTPDSTQWKSINLAAAIATAWALGIPFNIILAGTETFYSATATQTEA